MELKHAPAGPERESKANANHVSGAAGQSTASPGFQYPHTGIGVGILQLAKGKRNKKLRERKNKESQAGKALHPELGALKELRKELELLGQAGSPNELLKAWNAFPASKSKLDAIMNRTGVSDPNLSVPLQMTHEAVQNTEKLIKSKVRRMTQQGMVIVLRTFRFKAPTQRETGLISLWLESNKPSVEVKNLLANAAPQLMPVAVKKFKGGTVRISLAEIRNSLGSGQIAGTSYFVSDNGGYIRINYKKELDLGLIRYSIAKGKIGVYTINVNDQFQGTNLSRLLMALFCIVGIKGKAITWEFKTEDTSEGWWSQWSTDLKKTLARPDMQTIYLPADPTRA